jgi:hypothetical protein
MILRKGLVLVRDRDICVIIHALLITVLQLPFFLSFSMNCMLGLPAEFIAWADVHPFGLWSSSGTHFAPRLAKFCYVILL